MQQEKAGRVKLQKAKKKDEEVTYVVNTNTKNSINQTVAVSAIQSSRIEKKHQKQGKN